MVFWIVLAALTAAVVVAIARPLAGSARVAASQAVANSAVYRDQLEEIDQDRARGLIGDAEAEAARIEVSRRLLESSGRPVATNDKDAAVEPAVSNFAWLALGAVPLAAIALYVTIGSPQLPSQPHATRSAQKLDTSPIGELIARVEARLAEAPEDGAGWDAIAPVYLRLARYEQAATAFANAIRLRGDSVPRLLGFAEALIAGSGGNVVPDSARQAFERVLRLEPGRMEARFWLAVGKEQDSKQAEARADYESILADSPADAPWRVQVGERLTAVGGDPAKIQPKPPRAPPAGAVAPGAAQQPGPTQQDVQAAGQMSPDARQQMIRSMVEGLDQRLTTEGGDAAAWQRLIRSYIVLGEADKAKSSLARARSALASDSAALAALAAAERELGLAP